ncbi:MULTISPECIES: RHS repeat-associated core domain-containing protein [Pseudomonas]|uniref:RHS repeat-associated core domain-containing protein n=1 Tax=Pseudomonas TaxID=286 RepID=UPI0009BE208D|nr:MULTISPECIES: RHS repeat-associated core domain-containing protein [Pseudomonas]MBF8693590.1 RHS repeat-associated core domain-containing protein [Pseudomonas fulva]MEB8058024.1 RHS repeat-associated core domain-containing protein [Pseudomonas fulva]
MKARTLKIFYKGNKLSTLYTGSTHQTVLSANSQNLCETTSRPSQASLLATDAQSSTVSIVSESQTTINYGPYGNDSSPPDNPLLSRFTGQSWLPAAIGYLLGNGHRLFNPELMRFYSVDSLSPFGKGGINAYAYCSNDPINRSDPSGRYTSFFKWRKGGYSYQKLSPKLYTPNSSLSANEHMALGKSLKKRLSGARTMLSDATDRGRTEKIQHANHIIERLDKEKMLYDMYSATRSSKWRYTRNEVAVSLALVPDSQTPPPGPSSSPSPSPSRRPSVDSQVSLAFYEENEDAIMDALREDLRRLRE